MPILFERFENVASGKRVTLDADGFLRQFGGGTGRRVFQHWMRAPHHHPNDGTYRLINRATGRVIDVPAGNFADGQQLQHHQSHGGANQRWRIVATDDDPNAYFIHAADTDKVWEIPGGAPDPGLPVQLQTLNGNANQRWRIDDTDQFARVWLIRSVSSGLVLDVEGLSQQDGASIQQSDLNGGFNQMWDIIDLPAGTKKLRSVCSGKLLDYPLAPALNDQVAFLSQYAENGGQNQVWIFHHHGHDPGGNELVEIASMVNDFRVDVPGFSAVSGTGVQAYPANHGANQRWQVSEAPLDGG